MVRPPVSVRHHKRTLLFSPDDDYAQPGDELISFALKVVQRTISTDLKLAGTVQRLDRAQMKRALLNVVLNAMDAIEKGGRLSITSRPDGDGVALPNLGFKTWVIS